MIRIVHGVVLESKSSENVRVRVHDLGNGQLEASAVRETDWQELEMSPFALEHYLEARQRHLDETVEERAAKRLQIAANRAKKRVRRLCKVMGADSLLTLTYQANQCDLETTKKHLKEFSRRLRRVLPEFRGVATFEQQKRGAWHVHMATVKFPKELAATNGVKVKSFNVIRAIWRSVTKELGGNADISNAKGAAKRTTARIAAYISKYIAKGFEDGEAHKNRYTTFGKVEIPPSVDLGSFPGMAQAITAIYALLEDNIVIVDQHASKWSDWFFLHGEKKAPSGAS